LNITKLLRLSAVSGLLSILLLGCAVEVPGGVDDFNAATETPGLPTATPVIIAPALEATSTRVPPPPTPTRAPTRAPDTATLAPTATQTVAAPTEASAQPTASTSTAQATTAATIQTAPTTAPTQAAATTAPTQAAPVASGEMIAIKGGAFQMGSAQGDPDERPPHEVTVSDFQMDRFEVTNTLFDAFVQATGYQTENEKGGKAQTWRTFSTPDTTDNPVVMVTWADANAYCQWAGKRLPTEAEWEYAARGTDGRIYPWGNDYDPSKFNGKASGIHGTVHVGSYPSGESAFGIDDMAGNVWEWTADWYQAYPGGPASQFYGEKFRVTRGGGWFDEQKQVRASNRSSADPTAANDDLGFRCVK